MEKINYSKLKGKIIEVFETQKDFATALGITYQTLSLKLSGQVEFKQFEILKACELLGIDLKDIKYYFYWFES